MLLRKLLLIELLQGWELLLCRSELLLLRETLLWLLLLYETCFVVKHVTRIGKIYVSDLGSVAGCLPRRLEKIAVAQVPRVGQGTPKNREGNSKQSKSDLYLYQSKSDLYLAI